LGNLIKELHKMAGSNRLSQSFFCRDVLTVAPDLLGKYIVIKNGNAINRFMITEVEAYRGEEDLACHASRGRTERTRVLYSQGGAIYVYLIYGMYWMFNIVTGEQDNPQAVLLRGIESVSGPGRVSKKLNINKSYYGEDITQSARIWIEDSDVRRKIFTGPRIGIDYAGPYWSKMPWRYWIENE